MTMRAIAITKPGGPDVLALVERETPEPSRGEVRVRVRATAINRADLLRGSKRRDVAQVAHPVFFAESETALAHRGEISAHEKPHVGAGKREPSAIITSERAGADKPSRSKLAECDSTSRLRRAP